MLTPRAALEQIVGAKDLPEATKVARDTLTTAPPDLSLEEIRAAHAAVNIAREAGRASGEAHTPLEGVSRKLALHEAFHRENAKELQT